MNLPLEKQVASLELSKRLRELGVPQDSHFYWFESSPSKWEVGTWEEAMNAGRINKNNQYTIKKLILESGLITLKK